MHVENNVSTLTLEEFMLRTFLEERDGDGIVMVDEAFFSIGPEAVELLRLFPRLRSSWTVVKEPTSRARKRVLL